MQLKHLRDDLQHGVMVCEPDGRKIITRVAFFQGRRGARYNKKVGKLTSAPGELERVKEQRAQVVVAAVRAREKGFSQTPEPKDRTERRVWWRSAVRCLLGALHVRGGSNLVKVAVEPSS